MDFFDSLTDQRIDSPVADLVDQLLQRYLPELTACAVPLSQALEQLKQQYPLTDLPAQDINYSRTALSVIETYFPEDAAYLHPDWEERMHAAGALAQTLHLHIVCTELQDTGTGHTFYEQQRQQYEKRTAGLNRSWRKMPIRLCAELTTGYCLITGSDLLQDILLCLRGITQEDIDQRTPALIAYLRAKYRNH